MSHGFHKFERAVHAVRRAGFRFHRAQSGAAGAGRLPQGDRGHLPRPLDLHEPAEPLAQFVRGQFDLIEMRRARALLSGLNLRRQGRSLLQ